jgi:hypothetical protein
VVLEVWVLAGDQNTKEPTTRAELGPFAGARQRGQLLAKRNVLQGRYLNGLRGYPIG